MVLNGALSNHTPLSKFPFINIMCIDAAINLKRFRSKPLIFRADLHQSLIAECRQQAGCQNWFNSQQSRYNKQQESGKFENSKENNTPKISAAMSNPTSPKKTAEGTKVTATLSTSTSSFEALDPHDPQLNHLASLMFSKSAEWMQVWSVQVLGERTSSVRRRPD